MAEADPQEELLQPVTLDPPAKTAKPPSLVRLGLGVLLAGCLGLWTAGMLIFFRQSPEDLPEPLPSGGGEAVEKVPEEGEDVVSKQSPTPIPGVAAATPVLTLRSDPSGASVLIDGLFVGTTPLELEKWRAGQTLQFRKAGFQPIQSSTPSTEETKEVVVEFRVETADVRLSGETEGAVIRVNGIPVKPAANGQLTLPLTGSQIRIEKPGFLLWERDVTPARAYVREIKVELVPETAEGEPEETVSVVKESPAKILNSLGLEMIRPELPLKAVIGSPLGTPGRKSHEGIRHIRLERPFRMSSTEISNEQFNKFDPAHSSGTAGSIALSAPGLPVVGITWEQAVQFCNWLSEQEGLPPAYREQQGRWAFDPNPGTGYRLPSEAEWEGILRRHAGSGVYAWGDKLPPPEGSINLAGEESNGRVRTVLSGFRDPWPGPAPVGDAPEGPEGFRGVAGNVKEWVHDGFSAPRPSASVEVDPMVDSAARFHVIKGASWQDGSWMDFAISRRRYDDQPARDLGFRVARYVE